MDGRRRNVTNEAAETRLHLIAGMVAGTALLFGVVVAADAAKDSRLAGTFDVTATVVAGTDPDPGTKFKRTYQFRPLCKAGPCNKVKFLRENAGHEISKVILTRGQPGVYKGEKTYPVICDRGRADFTERHRLEIVNVKRGKVTKLKGRSSYHFADHGAGCIDDQKTRWVGSR